MSFETLLAIIEVYIDLKSQAIPKAAPTVSDWDCGLAAEFESSVADAGRRERLEKAGAAVERAFEEYIDERIRAVLAGKTAEENGPPAISRAGADR